tara:strand:- start:212 stop:670 length:459 start_codon:yes stop_codon:yes gene_type:complete
MNNFKDKENYKIHIENLKNLQSIGHLLLYIKNLYPDWITNIHPCFSFDYDILNVNWLNMCKNKIKVTPKDIILVKEDEFKSNSNFLATSCNIITNCGFLVRKNTDYIKCKNCNKLIPTKKTILNIINNNNMKYKKFFPKNWKNCCTDCNKKS